MSNRHSVLMHQTFPFKLIDGHIIIGKKNNEIIIDTGSPNSYLRKNFNLPFFQTKGIDVIENETLLNEISSLIGLNTLSAIVGCDILSKLDLSIDLLSSTIMIFSPREQEDIAGYFRYCTILPISTYQNLPVVNLNVNGETKKMFFDTGAKINYINHAIVNGLEPAIKNAVDFLPFGGTFKTDLYKLEVTLDKNKLSLHFGVLPEQFSQILSITNIDGILGTEILKSHYMYISLSNKFICFSKLPEEVYPDGSKERWLQKLKYTSNMSLLDSDLAETMPEDCYGYEEAISIIKRKMLSLTPGSTLEYLKKLLNKIS